MQHPIVEKTLKEFQITLTPIEERGELRPVEKKLMKAIKGMSETEVSAFTMLLIYCCWKNQNGIEENEEDTQRVQEAVLAACAENDLSILEDYLTQRKAELLKIS